MDPKMKHAMGAVLENMGRAAREGKARRFQKKPVEVTMGEVTLEPHKGDIGNPPTPGSEMAGYENDISPEELDEMAGGIQR